MFPLFICAQRQNSVWVFGDSAGINFNINTTVPISSGMDGKGSCVSISDTSGQLLFYAYTRSGISAAYTGRVCNSLHQEMQNGDSIMGGGLYNEMVIAPFPERKLYYLFSVGVTYVPTQGCYYSLISMEPNGGLGEVLQKNVQVNNFRNGDCITAVKHANGRDWWVFSKYSDLDQTTYNRFYIYLVTADSVYPPIIQDLNNSMDCDFQKIVFNKEGSRFMQLNARGFMCEYDFDRCTGIISNPSLIYPEIPGAGLGRYFFDGAYSYDATRFYASTTRWTTLTDSTYIFQFDLTSPNVSSTCDTIFTTVFPTVGGVLRLAPDRRIYHTSWYFAAFPFYPYTDSVRNIYNQNLTVINYPDSLGTACDIQPFSYYLAGKRSYAGLPNNPDYSLGAVTGSACDSLMVGVDDHSAISSAALKVFYHPSWQVAYINSSGLRGNKYRCEIRSIDGRIIYDSEGMLSSVYFTQDINMSAFANGVYIVNFVTDKERLAVKFVKY